MVTRQNTDIASLSLLLYPSASASHSTSYYIRTTSPVGSQEARPSSGSQLTLPPTRSNSISPIQQETAVAGRLLVCFQSAFPSPLPLALYRRRSFPSNSLLRPQCWHHLGEKLNRAQRVMTNSSSCFQTIKGPQLVHMAATVRTETEMKMDAKKRLRVTTDPLEKLRLQCLARGCSGIKGLGRMFRIIDDDGSRKLESSEFMKGMHDFGVVLDKDELNQIFAMLDRDKSGFIDFDEFLIAIRPAMSQGRQNIVMQAFRKLDKSGDGVVKVEDMENVYRVDKHPKYISGEKSKEDLFKDFLKTFEMSEHPDGIVTRDEFLNYYAGLSASIDSDIYFDLMMRTCWKI
uniref:EF-hand domain-containing protein n=1 Tax=Plectus sambesii TaxID=2011161 RepID=A0A914X615_9BILA